MRKKKTFIPKDLGDYEIILRKKGSSKKRKTSKRKTVKKFDFNLYFTILIILFVIFELLKLTGGIK